MKTKKKQSPTELAVEDPFSPDLFVWRVPIGGFKWGEELGRRRPTEPDTDIEVLLRVSPGAGVREYNPLHVPKIFQELADTPCTREGILEFANRYGLLGIPDVELRLEYRPLGEEEYSEQIGTWDREIVAMKAAIAVWEAIKKQDDAMLARSVVQFEELDTKGVKSVRTLRKFDPGSWVLMAQAGDAIEYTVLPTSADSREEAAWALLKLLANERLLKNCAPILADRSARATKKTPLLKVVPKNLLGACWWQFSRVICGEAEFRKCEACSKYVEISNEKRGKQAGWLYCSDACRTRAHRAKVKEAKAMKADGKTITAIAEHFEVEKNTVKAWLAK